MLRCDIQEPGKEQCFRHAEVLYFGTDGLHFICKLHARILPMVMGRIEEIREKRTTEQKRRIAS